MGFQSTSSQARTQHSVQHTTGPSSDPKRQHQLDAGVPQKGGLRRRRKTIAAGKPHSTSHSARAGSRHARVKARRGPAKGSRANTHTHIRRVVHGTIPDNTPRTHTPNTQNSGTKPDEGTSRIPNTRRVTHTDAHTHTVRRAGTKPHADADTSHAGTHRAHTRTQGATRQALGDIVTPRS